MNPQPLPLSWSLRSLEELVQVLDRQRVPINNKERQERLAASATRYPYYGATGQVGEIDDYIFDGEAVLLGEDGAPFLEPYRNKAYLARGKYWVNNHAHILRGNGALDNGFLCHQLNTLNYRSYVSGTTRLKLTQASMNGISLRVPPFNEQRRIVEKIETLFAQLDKGEEAVRQAQKLLARYRQSVLKAAVTGELTADWRAERKGNLEHGRDLLTRILKTRREQWSGRGKYKEPAAPDTSGLPKLPEGWVWASMGQLLHKIEAGKNYKCWERPPRAEEFGIVKISAVTWDEFDEEESKTIANLDHIHPAYRIEQGDLLISRANTIGLVGASVVVRDIGKRLQLSDKVLRLRLVGPLEEWVNYVLKSFLGRSQIEAFATGAQMSMRNISQANLEKIVIPLPPSAEMNSCVASIVTAHQRHSILKHWCETELKRASALRQSILKDAFAGKLVPQDPDDEPASELLARIAAEKRTSGAKPRRKLKEPG